MKNEWTKTLLYVYKYLERVCEGIDKLVDESAMNSFYYRRSGHENNVVDIANRIIELTDRKTKLINIKVLVDNCLLKLDRLYAQLLIEKYIDEEISDRIALKHGLNVRTYFRKSSQAENTFTNLMSKEGFNDEKLNTYLSSEKWIVEVYEKFKQGSLS